MRKVKIAVVGAGSWGTALAVRLATNGHEVKLCCYDKDAFHLLSRDKVNEQFLPNIKFPNNLEAFPFRQADILDCDYCLFAVPSVGFAATLDLFADKLKNLGHIIWATKGMDPKTHKLFSSLVKAKFSSSFKMGVLTGPSFAVEVGSGLPTAVSIASNDDSFARQIQELFHCPVFRTYICDDIIGAQVGGALKNVIAIAVGISDGLEYGANSRAALITRGLAETQRLGLKLGAKAQTFMGLTGMGDLVLTCTDNKSRNRRFGLYLGQGMDKENAMLKVKQVVEGAETVSIVYELAKSYGIEMPISNAVYDILYNNISAKDAVLGLLSREAKREFG